MSVARDLATFLTQVSHTDIPLQALEHAAMLISSTVASAAGGSGIASSSIIRDLAKERGGTPEAVKKLIVQEKASRAHELRAKGFSYSQIMKELGVSKATVVNYLKGYPYQNRRR